MPASVLRSPEELSPAGCSYSVKIAQRNLARALTILHGARLPYLGIYVNSAGYGCREVTPRSSCETAPPPPCKNPRLSLTAVAQALAHHDQPRPGQLRPGGAGISDPPGLPGGRC
ncbi:MAG: putative Se/S carrier-like protein [Evtepia sp.]